MGIVDTHLILFFTTYDKGIFDFALLHEMPHNIRIRGTYFPKASHSPRRLQFFVHIQHLLPARLL